jgi:protein-S-isoprenylcysteine O-methyltransferase Ste14
MCPLHRLFEIRPAATSTHEGGPGPGEAARAGVTAGGVAIFAYGLVAYAAFFGTIVYAIGFVTGWVVPKTIDSGAGPASAVGVVEALVVNGSILALFVVQHTVMARRWFKAWWTRLVPAAIERSTYVLAASVVLMLLFWQWRPLPAVVWSVEHSTVAGMLRAIGLAGWGIVLSSSFMVSHTDLFGLRQSVFGLLGRVYEPVGFRLRGLYRVVRHPLMVGFLIAFWVTPVMTVGHLLFAIMTTGYIAFGTWIEERDLLAEHGEAYAAYRRRVPGFVPGLARG